MDRFAALRTYVTVVDKGSFAAAAEFLRISRAMATKHVADLEAHLGTRLLNRTTRRLSLTEAGADFLKRGQEILDLFDEAERAATTATAQPSGILRINAPVSFGVLHLADAVCAYHAAFPRVAVELSLNDRIVDLVEEGFDLAVRIGTLKDSSLMARRLAPCRLLVAAAPDYLRRHGDLSEPDDLQAHQCLLYTYASEGNLWQFEREGRVRAVKVAGPMRSNNGETLMRAAVNGMGVILQPTFMLSPAIQSGTLNVVLPDWNVPGLGIYAVWPHGRHLSAKVRSFVDFLVEQFTAEPYWDRGILPSRKE
ncbi:MAG: LysR family transcriptional regulator [Hyphomicrobiales bacterium]|nr:LysR family transcriptional regulator [Hyphomicrobiales bacterium]